MTDLLDLTEGDVERLLSKWAYWVKSANRLYQKLWYPPNIIDKMKKLGVMLVGYGHYSDYDFSLEAENVDKIMRDLKSFNRSWFDAIFASFMSPYKRQHQIAAMLGCGRTALLKDLSSGMAWVAGALSRTEGVEKMLGRAA